TALQRRLQLAQSPRIEPAVMGRELCKTLEIGAVARMRHHQRAAKRPLRERPPPQNERADAEPRAHGLGTFSLAPGREHAAGPMACGLRHRGVTALMHSDGVSGPCEQQRMPGAGYACAYDGNGGLLGLPAFALVLVHPCPFAGMTRIRFKGSPR